MRRTEIIHKIGEDYLQTNTEAGEFSYVQALGRPISGHNRVDLRFTHDNYSILIETKRNRRLQFLDDEIDQIQKYASLERELKKYNRIISILYNVESGIINV